MVPTVTKFAQNVSKRPILKLLKFYDHLIIISKVIGRLKYVEMSSRLIKMLEANFFVFFVSFGCKVLEKICLQFFKIILGCILQNDFVVGENKEKSSIL